MARYKFTESAASDLESIINYTLEHWGPRQVERYLAGMEELAQTLADTYYLLLKRRIKPIRCQPVVY